jgi:hypothetical protein
VIYTQFPSAKQITDRNRIPVKPCQRPLNITIDANNIASFFFPSPDLLKHYAPVFFAAADSKSGGTCQSGSVCEFDDVDVDTFAHFDVWLHHQPYFDRAPFNMQQMIDEDKEFDKQYFEQGPIDSSYSDAALLAAKTYLFASKYEISQLQKDTIDRLCVNINNAKVDFPSVAEYVYTHTHKEHILRKILVDGYCVERGDTHENKDSLHAFPQEFINDVMMRNAQLFGSAKGPLFEMDIHHYHECEESIVGGENRACSSRVNC